MTCASRPCLRSFSTHRQLLDIELYCHQPLQVLDLIYMKYHGNFPAVVLHHKQCCSHFRTAALKHETRQHSSSTNGLQLQQPTLAAVTFPPLSLTPDVPLRNLRVQRGVMRRGATWGIGGTIPDECQQTPRFTSTTPGRHIWDSTQLRQRRSGFTDNAGITRGRRHHERWHRNTTGYFAIGRVPFLALHSDR